MGALISLTTTLPLLLAIAQDPYANFTREFQAGADCPRLFELRNQAKRVVSGPEQREMNSKLDSVGCSSSASKRVTPAPPRTGGFTVRDYRILRSILAEPMSIPETDVLKAVAKRYGVTIDEAKKAARRVQEVLSRNNWMGRPENEIRHASDWKGEKQ